MDPYLEFSRAAADAGTSLSQALLKSLSPGLRTLFEQRHTYCGVCPSCGSSRNWSRSEMGINAPDSHCDIQQWLRSQQQITRTLNHHCYDCREYGSVDDNRLVLTEKRKFPPVIVVENCSHLESDVWPSQLSLRSGRGDNYEDYDLRGVFLTPLDPAGSAFLGVRRSSGWVWREQGTGIQSATADFQCPPSHRVEAVVYCDRSLDSALPPTPKPQVDNSAAVSLAVPMATASFAPPHSEFFCQAPFAPTESGLQEVCRPFDSRPPCHKKRPHLYRRRRKLRRRRRRRKRRC